ncbi:aldehyde dehydrogenase family protein [soil metagenome]
MIKLFYLDGKWVEGSASEEVVNPWNADKLANIFLASTEQVELAVASAHRAFAEAKRETAHERTQRLARIAALIGQRRDEFVSVLVAEAGKPVTFAEAEVDRAQMTFGFAAQLASADEGHGIRMDASAPGAGHFGFVRRFPIGVILGITPFNFPLNLVAHKVAPCLASGNTMVLKPALKTPLSSLLLAEVLHEAGVPAGQVNVVPFGHEHIPGLLADSRIKMLSFTGSAEVGWKLKAAAVKMKVALELGGNAAVVVEPDANWEVAIPKIALGAFGYAGQSCISVQRVYVHSSVYSAFRERFVSYVQEKVKTGDPADRSTIIGPMISSAARDKVVKWIREAQASGATILADIETLSGSLLGPVIVENAPRDAAVLRAEAFAPLVVLESYDSFADALAMVNDSSFGLQAGVFTSDLNKAFQAFAMLEVGGVMINQVPTFRVENMPYGGVKESGFGREGVAYAMEEMTEPRSLVIGLS